MRRTEPPTFKLQLGISGVRDNNCQHSFVNIDSRQIILKVHVFSLWRKRRTHARTYTHPHVLSLSTTATHTHWFNHAFQIKHHHGLNSSSVTTTLPLSAAARISKFS